MFVIFLPGRDSLNVKPHALADRTITTDSLTASLSRSLKNWGEYDITRYPARILFKR
jgi:hypothetical protein